MELLINLNDERIKSFNLSLSEIVFLNVYEQKMTKNDLSELYEIFEDMGMKRDTVYRNYYNLKAKGLVDYEAINQGRDLYLVSDIDKTVLKIGSSSNVNTRLLSLKNGNHLKIELLFCLKRFGSKEREVHKMFSKFRLSGEWFKYDESIINYFENEIQSEH